MRFLLASLLFLFAFHPVLANELASPVKPFTLRFSLLHNNSNLGVAELNYKPLNAALWQFTSTSKGTQGLAQVARASASETTLLAVKNGKLELKSNRIETKVAFSTRIKTTQLSNDGKTYLYKDHKSEKSVAYQAGAWDQHGLTIALMGDLAKKKASSFTYMVVNRNKIEPYTFKIMSYQVLETAMGKLNTVRVDRIRQDNKGKSTNIWFAVDKNYAPVLIQQFKTDGDDIEMRILSIN